VYKKLVITDIGSGSNEKKKGFLRLRLLDRVLHNEVNKVPVLYEGRLTRFGFDTLKDVKPPQQELVEDLITIISHFSGKLYGMRSSKQKEVVKRAKELFAKA